MDRMKPAIASLASFLRASLFARNRRRADSRFEVCDSSPARKFLPKASNPAWTQVVDSLCSPVFYSSSSPVSQGETRNYADGTNSSEYQVRRGMRDNCAIVRPQRMPVVIERDRRQSLHVSRPRSATIHACSPARPGSALLSGRPVAGDAEFYESDSSCQCGYAN